MTGTNNAALDYAHTIRWDGASYGLAETAASDTLGPPLFTVVCSIGEIERRAGGMQAEPGEWPDGTSTGLERGTVVHSLQEADPSCRLAVQNRGRLMVFKVDVDAPNRDC